MKIYPVILAGGSGTRLWPMSREAYPKQFLGLLEGKSPFQATLDRLQSVPRAQAPTVVASLDHRFLVQDQVKAAGRALRTDVD